MPTLVVNGAQMQCSFGSAPATLVVTPEKRTSGVKVPAATIMDYVPMKNVPPFGSCQTVSNPRVAAATAAPPPGVLKPQPCTPTIPAPWAPGSPTVLIGKVPALNNTSKAMCAYGGVISIVSPGQMNINVP